MPVQGNCTNAPPLAFENLDGVLNIPLRDMKPGQCLILLSAGFIHLAQDMWLDNLYLRLHKSAPDTTASSMNSLVDAEKAGLWMTNVTMQGDGDGTTDCRDCGIRMLTSLAYIEGTSSLQIIQAECGALICSVHAFFPVSACSVLNSIAVLQMVCSRTLLPHLSLWHPMAVMYT